MSDIGLFPPGAGVWFGSFAWMILCAAGLLICLLVAWLRTRRGPAPFMRDASTGWAIGAVVSAVAAGISMLLVDWSGSLGAFARWIDQSAITITWLLLLMAIWPSVALLWNRRRA